LDVDNSKQPVESEEYGRERSEAERLASLPDFLRLSPEQIEAARRENARLLADSNSPFLIQSPRDTQHARAVREESDWRRTLAMFDFEIRAGDKSEGTAARRRTAAQTLAENLEAQGRFKEAAHFHSDPEQRRWCLRLLYAVHRPDEDECEPECDRAFEIDPTRLTREDIVAEVYSIKHGKVMPVNRCFYCNSLNVRPASSENLRRRAMRARARGLTDGLRPDQAAATLRREKLTTADVFK
jgi:hypothetical protein